MMILILHGPNLNLLGWREPEVYGTTTLEDVNALCASTAAELGLQVECHQSNHEGDLIDKIHAYGRWHREGKALGAVFNPGAFTHTSIALHDAIKGTGLPVVQRHVCRRAGAGRQPAARLRERVRQRGLRHRGLRPGCGG